MKITASQSTPVNPVSAGEQNRTRPTTASKTERCSAIDPVLGEAQRALAALPEVDMKQVNAVKEAIGSGKMTVDIDALTAAVQHYFQR